MAERTAKTRPGKSRAACEPCRSVKQKCDGATRYPCRRCEIYGIECTYEGGAPPATAVRRHIPHHDPLGTPGGGSAVFVAPPAFDPNASTGMAAAMMSMASSLRTITERLQNLETRLDSSIPNRSTNVSSPSNTSSPAVGALMNTSEPSPSTPGGVELAENYNPMQVVVEEIGKIEAKMLENAGAAGVGDGAGGASGSGSAAGALLGKGKVGAPPDALLRGFLSVSDVQMAFNFFMERIQPWMDIVAPDKHVDPLVMREKSPLLFHAVLLVINYFNTAKTERAAEVYRGLTEIVKLLIAEMILCPDNLTPANCTALILTIHFKPVQYGAFYARGIYDAGRIVHASKVNPLSSMMIHALMHRISSYLRLPQAPQNFLDAVATGAPIPPEVTENLRIWFWLCRSDIQGSVQSGRSCQTDATSALLTTRQFANMRLIPSDVRGAATIECYAIARTPIEAPQATTIRLNNIARLHDELDKWEQFWPAKLMEAQTTGGDTLAYTTFTSFHFVTLSIMSTVFTRWNHERRKSLDEGGNGRPVLSTQDWSAIQRAADACSKVVFSVSVEAAQGSPVRTAGWPALKSAGYRDALNLDPQVIHHYTTGLDTVTCVIFTYACLLLVRLASAGLISCEIQAMRNEYESGADLDVPQPLGFGQKLPRLLLLGSQFLKVISPQPNHPAYKQGELLEMILEAGLGAETPHGQTPTSPPQPTVTNPLPPVPQVVSPPDPDTNVMMDTASAIPSWLDDVSVPSSGTATPSRRHLNGETAGEAMRSLLDDMSGSSFPTLPDGTGPDYFGGLDGMMVDWTALAKSWDVGDLASTASEN
ncbi:hypothetical protein T439DRAFT_321817 [Meredithblackwellia eburnea MCA 4105]